MQAHYINGWREVLARVLDGFEQQLGLTPDWLVNPATNRRLKLDYYLPEVDLAIRFVGLAGAGKRRRKSDEEVQADSEREGWREEVCFQHGVTLISIDPDSDPREGLRSLERGLARAAARLAQGGTAQSGKVRLMPMLSQARQRAGEFTLRLTSVDSLAIYAEAWRDRESALSVPAPTAPGTRRHYSAGMPVRHKRFGPGRVVSLEQEAQEEVVVVDFGPSGVRSFAVRLVGDILLPL